LGRVGGQEPGAAALAGRLGAAESSLTSLAASLLLARASGILHFGNGSGWGTSTTRVFMRPTLDQDTALDTSVRRLVVPFDLELLGAIVVGAAGSGSATITLSLFVNASSGTPGKTIVFANDFSTGGGNAPVADWTASPLAVPAAGSLSRYLTMAVDKSGAVASSALGVGVGLAYRRTA
jgi:hypothetical protein